MANPKLFGASIMTSFRDCGMCGGSGCHSFERCYECKGTGMVEDEAEADREWQCLKCGDWWEDCVPDCMNCNPPLGSSFS